MFNEEIIIKVKNIIDINADFSNDEITIVAKVSLADLENNKQAGILPQKYIINNNATILFWNDGSKTIVKRAKEDEYNKILGFLWAYFQKTSGLSKTKVNKYLKNLTDNSTEYSKFDWDMSRITSFDYAFQFALENAKKIAKSINDKK